MVKVSQITSGVARG